MPHDHSSHDHSHQGHGHHHHPHASSRNILVALGLNVVFTVIEFSGGILTGSVAILADAIHDLGDSVALVVAYGLERYAKRNRDEHYSYGYGRYSLLSALISGLVLVLGGILVLREAIPRLWGAPLPKVNGMIGLAILGVLVNGFAAWRLSRGKTTNEKVLSWHLIEDTLGWGATLVGAGLMRVFAWPIIDPLLAIFVSLFVLWNAVRNLREVLRLLLQGMPVNFDRARFEQDVLAIPGVRALHDLRGWSLDGASSVLSLHLVLNVDLPGMLPIKKLVHGVAGRHGVRHITIETECVGEACVANDDDK